MHFVHAMRTNNEKEQKKQKRLAASTKDPVQVLVREKQSWAGRECMMERIRETGGF